MQPDVDEGDGRQGPFATLARFVPSNLAAAPTFCEEVFINRAELAYIQAPVPGQTLTTLAAQNNYVTTGATINFPTDAVEVKADWIPASSLVAPSFDCVNPPAGLVTETIGGQCYALAWVYGGSYDGKPVPVTGNPNADTATRKRLSPTTTETTFTKGGKVTSVNTSVVSADGKTMTITAKGTTAQGQPLAQRAALREEVDAAPSLLDSERYRAHDASTCRSSYVSAGRRGRRRGHRGPHP